MAIDDSQQKSLEALKLINAAFTARRLYPSDSSQVRSSTEKAYLGVKSFLRKYGQLRCSHHDGISLLAGTAVDKPTQERLQLLSFHDLLHKMGLKEMILERSLGRETFIKFLSVFSATPDQIKKAGGSRSFIAQLQLNDVFPEKYTVTDESTEETTRKRKVDCILNKLSENRVRPDDLHYLYGKKKGGELQAQLLKKFQTVEDASCCIATACYSLLQILQKDKTVSVAPAFTIMLERVAELIQIAGKAEYDEYARKTAQRLVPTLGDPSVMILLCQHYPENFGSAFYSAIIGAVGIDCLSRVYCWMERQHEKSVASPDGGTKQMRAVCIAYERFQRTSRAKQLMAANNASELIAKTEESRKTKRVQVGIEALAAGDMVGLKNKEVCISLPITIANLLRHDKESLAGSIIENVVNGFRKDEKGELCGGFTQVVGGIAAQLVCLKRWDWLEKLTPVCLFRIREIEELDSSYMQYVQAMQDMMNHAWATGNNDLAEQILDVFYYIRSGAFEKSDELRRTIADIQDKNVDLALLKAYLDECFIRPVDELICKKITMQGPVAARFLLDTLISSDVRSDRIRLLKLLSEIGEGLVPVLLERLPDPMPWYGKRNVIRLLAETGSEENVDVVLPYVTHEDLRVQQESLQCITRLGKAAKGKYLLKVLPDVTLRMKIQVVQNLGRVGDESIIAPLATLLNDCKMYNGEEKDELADEVCRSLGATGSTKAIPVLQKVVDASGKVLGKGSYLTALNTVSLLRELKRNRLKSQKTLPPSAKVEEKESSKPQGKINESAKPIEVASESITDSAEEAEVYEFLGRDKLEGAKKVLLSLIKKRAGIQQFKKAEALRLRLIDIDPMALADIIKAAEYIEDAKTAGVDEDHIIIWSELYDLLSTEEFNVFYHALVHEKYSLEKNIVTQGDTQWRLFFVNKGRVKLYYQEKDSEILVKTIGSGQIFGGESFFNDSVWTLNAASMGSVEISTLDVGKLREWKESYPGLEPILQDYCKRMSTEQDFFQSSGANRRTETRHDFPVSLTMELLTENGQSEEGLIKGFGTDLSTGGLSFDSPISRRKDARMLLGRTVKVVVENEESTELMGRVVAVRNLHLTGHGRSVHISFEEKFDEASVSNLIHKARSN